MTVQDLKEALRHGGIREHAYDLECGERDEVYCLDAVQGGWRVYYRERGLRRDERFLTSEDAATRYFLDLITRDPTTRL